MRLTSFYFLRLAFILYLPIPLCGQQHDLLVKPFLQDGTPTSMIVKWETASGEESVVEYGETPKLGKKKKGTAYPVTYSPSRLHEVKLEGLKRYTVYYYRVKTGQTISDVYQFKTPPLARDGKSFRITAMSDMQEDDRNPDKFGEIINDGLLSYLKKTYGGNIPDNLALMMIPGDLIDNASVYEHWKRDFFDPASELFSRVPIYPVPGNHEENSQYFFTYFSLPQNGTPAHNEHWWYKDYGNIRVIGLDTNTGYRRENQLNWLDDVLNNAAANDSIDFVFAQMHHPFKSELWLDGELDYTGEVVKRMEAFSTRTGKPSIHFFGHTHAYSRGQSRDHKHLWVNVATAGGTIDYWGAFEQMNHNEFSVSQDEYGFVMVDINPNAGDPYLTVRRYSRGNEKQFRDNELRDSVSVWRFDKKPAQPIIVSPASNSTIGWHDVFLKASPFKTDFHRAEHGGSHWQVSETPDFEKPVVDSWRQYEDWYVYHDLQKDDDLTDEKLSPLSPVTKYYWRVRYRDKNLNWSPWSEVSSFITGGR